ncbi:hypothetical protein JCM1840_003332 [Sporobolomyces johnsonii]
MLVVSILPLRGNPSTPEFPFDGAFGLTDVSVRGKVVTKLDQLHPNPKPVEAVEVIVRLVRIDGLNRTTFRETVCEKTLWRPPTGQTSSKLGEWEGEFELVVPAATQGLSRMGIMVGKVPGHCATISYKLEAVVSFPKERPTSAPPRELRFLRHSLPSSSSPSIPSLSWSSTSSTVAPPFPSLDYDVHVANRPLGWNDTSEISYHFRVPQSTTFHLKSLELVLCREVTILNSASTSTFVDELPLDLFREDGVPAPTRPPHKSRSPLAPRHSSPEPPASPFSTPAVIPTDEHGRPLPVVPRSPSPPEKASGPRTSWPLVLAEGEAGYFETRGVLRFRARPVSNHRWSLGETGENRFVRCSFAIRPKILYKRSTGPFASDKIFDLQPLPMQVAAVTATSPFKTARQPRLASRMGERRISDFSLTIDLAATSSPAPPLPSPSALEDRRLSAAAAAQRPLSGRRRSEQSEAFGQPARTRARTEEPKPLRRPSTATGVVPSSLAPEVSHMPSSISPSSTYDSLGPDTPNTLEFLLTPVPVPALHIPSPVSPPPVRSGSFPLATPMPRIPHSSSSSASRPPSSRSTRSLRHSYRPRSAGTLSIASTASTASSAADSGRFQREMSAPASTGSSPTILESSHELLGLTLSDDRISSSTLPHPLSSSHRHPGDFAVSTSPSPSASSSPSPPSFPSASPSFVARVVAVPAESKLSLGNYTLGAKSTPTLPLDRSPNMPWDDGYAVSPRKGSTGVPRRAPAVPSVSLSPRARSPSRTPTPPSSPAPLKSNVMFTNGSAGAADRSLLHAEASLPAAKRKGSVGGLFSLITRKGFKVQ